MTRLKSPNHADFVAALCVAGSWASYRAEPLLRIVHSLEAAMLSLEADVQWLLHPDGAPRHAARGRLPAEDSDGGSSSGEGDGEDGEDGAPGAARGSSNPASQEDSEEL